MGENKDKIKGKAKEIVGTVTGNRRMQAEGLGLQARGAMRGAAKGVKHALTRSTRRTNLRRQGARGVRANE